MPSKTSTTSKRESIWFPSSAPQTKCRMKQCKRFTKHAIASGGSTTESSARMSHSFPQPRLTNLANTHTPFFPQHQGEYLMSTTVLDLSVQPVPEVLGTSSQ